jgi:hypothetical protein
MRTLMITKNAHAAHAFGMGMDGTHKVHKTDLRFWWPELGTDRLRGCQYDMIVFATPARNLSPDDWDFMRVYLFRSEVIVAGDL